MTDSNTGHKCSIGIFAHNEAANIGSLLRAVCGQTLDNGEITEVIVVSSASTDGTDDIVRDFGAVDSRVRLIAQAKREGKSAAINLFLAEAKGDIQIVISGDVIPEPGALAKIVNAFNDPKVGAAGGRPMPVNDPRTFMGYAVHLLWRLHHRMALISPKLGELIAFRGILDGIPADSAVDEASIEAIIRARGFRLKYVGEAHIRNKGPETLADFIKQRRRIQNGHLWLKARQSYRVASQDGGTLGRIMLDEMRERPCDIPKLLGVMALEFWSRVLGSADYYLWGKNPFKWDIVRSTKNLNR